MIAATVVTMVTEATEEPTGIARPAVVEIVTASGMTDRRAMIAHLAVTTTGDVVLLQASVRIVLLATLGKAGDHREIVRLVAVEVEDVVAVAAAVRDERDAAPRNVDHLHLKAQCLCLRDADVHLDGTSMLPATSSIVPCRRSKLVRAGRLGSDASHLNSYPSAGLFNLPGANRTQVAPILGIAGLPPPMPVQSFGMGIGGNPSLSRQSRRLYIGSITPDINEQNLTDFFNGKMIEMGIGTGGPGNPVLAVQCNYEKNYAFVEVSS